MIPKVNERYQSADSRYDDVCFRPDKRFYWYEVIGIKYESDGRMQLFPIACGLTLAAARNVIRRNAKVCGPRTATKVR